LHFTISSTLREHSPFNTSSVNDSMLSQLLIYRFWRAWRLMISFRSSSSLECWWKPNFVTDERFTKIRSDLYSNNSSN
jgi:hypothetical protein